MKQLSFLDIDTSNKPVNVSSVPQRSPFRYPGGKTWLVPIIRKWVNHYSVKPTNFIEPFAGGGIIGLTVAFENLADKITLVEIDDEVAAVWKTILSDDNDWLANKISSFNLTLEKANYELQQPAATIKELAFKTILKNRIFHGGILAPGAGLLKYGESGKGIFSRWYPKTISRRIINIGLFRSKIFFIHGDGLKVISDHINENNILFFIDPPYTAGGKKAGSRLYKHYLIDHEELFHLANQLPDNFLMTYDDSIEVHRLAQKYGFDTELVAMNNTHHAKMSELLIARDLTWIRR
jgi:DNA adenine methylase